MGDDEAKEGEGGGNRLVCKIKSEFSLKTAKKKIEKKYNIHLVELLTFLS